MPPATQLRISRSSVSAGASALAGLAWDSWQTLRPPRSCRRRPGNTHTERRRPFRTSPRCTRFSTGSLDGVSISAAVERAGQADLGWHTAVANIFVSGHEWRLLVCPVLVHVCKGPTARGWHAGSAFRSSWRVCSTSISSRSCSLVAWRERRQPFRFNSEPMELPEPWMLGWLL